jgi:hypothetical protein
VRALASNPGRVVQLVQWSLRAGAATGTPLLEAALDGFVAGSPLKSSVVAFDETAEHVVCAAGRRFAPIYAVSVLGQPPPPTLCKRDSLGEASTDGHGTVDRQRRRARGTHHRRGLGPQRVCVSHRIP